MCEERERLIGYVYEECDPAERKVIEAHLASCHTCRREIGGLRSVRQDLLAWKVPDHQPVWRPVPPARAEWTWSRMPAWAMTAAAGFVLMLGAAGGAATHALLPESPTPQVVQQSAPTAVTSSAGFSAAELSALEERMLEKVRAEMEERVRLARVEATQTNAARAEAATASLARRVNALSSRQDELSRFMLDVASETVAVRTKQSGLEHNNRMLSQYVMQVSAPGGR
jgi:hypothetical protein